jgi:hypothetical protein
MSITRVLPYSDVKRIDGLTVTKDKQASTAPANSPLTTKTATRLTATQPLFAQKIAAREAALQAQGESTSLKSAAQDKARTYISHYFQSFNNGIVRGMFPASHRAFYGIDLTDSAVPQLTNEIEVLHWGDKIKTGDVARLAAGGAPMAMPATEEVNDVCTAYALLVTQHSAFKDAYDTAQEGVADMRLDVDNLILRIWDEVETSLDDEPPASKRRKAREWGVVYHSTQKTVISGTVRDAVSGTVIEGAFVTLIESENKVQTDGAGNYTMETTFVGQGTLEFGLEGYATQSIPVEVPEGSTLVQNAKLQKV